MAQLTKNTDDWFRAYCDSRRGELRTRSENVYWAWWHRYREFLSQHRLGLEPHMATTSDAAAFLRHYEGNTAIRYFRLLQAVYATAVEAGLSRQNPLTALANNYNREEESVNVPAAGPAAVEALYELKTGATWKNARDRALVLLAAEAGLRRQELIVLTLRDLVLDGMLPRVRLKTPAKSRDIELGPKLHQELLNWRTVRKSAQLAGDLAFPANPEGRALDPSTVYRIIERHLAKVGAGKSVLGSSGTQVLRATLAHATVGQGKKVGDLQQLLGHQHRMSTVDLLTRIVTEPKPASDS
jgi:integrase